VSSLGLLVAGVLLALVPFAAACSPSDRTHAAGEFIARAGARRYELSGKVVRVDASGRKVTLAHNRIPGYMDAMTMELAVKEEWALAQMGSGDQVRAVLVVDGARSWIEMPAITKAAGTTAATATRGTWVPADPGTPLPDVPLVDQDGKPFRLDRYRGHVLLITFSFTRCPLPDYCPLMMKQFAAIERQTAQSPALKPVRLLTVTIDPAHDTPPVLRAYGEKHATGDGGARRFSRWNLATGTQEDVKKLAAFFGLDYFQEQERIIHSLRTAIVDPEGRVVKVFGGNEWTVEEVMRELQAVEPARSAAPRPS
jgi:protein SCO1